MTPIANTIYDQMGGYRFTAMTGAKNFVDAGTGLRFKVPRARNGITRVVIDLNGRDLYDMKFYKIKNYEAILIEEFEGVDAENLQGIFARTTGLDTNL